MPGHLKEVYGYTTPHITDTLRASLVRVRMSQSDAARLLGMAKTHLSDIILMKRRMTPEFVDAWCTKIEPRSDNLVRRHLNYLGAASDGWDLTLQVIKT